MTITSQTIAKKVKELRLERRWTQVQLARLLGLSQNRLSEIESGKGSFTAEQLITLLANFNVSLDYFAVARSLGEGRLQNALASLGARHLQESPGILVAERVREVVSAACEAIVAAKSPRLVTALAPVIVNYSEAAILNQIRFRLLDSGFIHRYGWVLENILEALRGELNDHSGSLPGELRWKYKKAESSLAKLLGFPKFLPGSGRTGEGVIWAVDEEIVSEKTFAEVQKESSRISKKWGIVTRLQPADFVRALRDGFNY